MCSQSHFRINRNYVECVRVLVSIFPMCADTFLGPIIVWFFGCDLKIVPGFFCGSLLLVRVHSWNRNEIIGIIEARTQQWFSTNVFLMCSIYHRTQNVTDQKKKGKNWDSALFTMQLKLMKIVTNWPSHVALVFDQLLFSNIEKRYL